MPIWKQHISRRGFPYQLKSWLVKLTKTCRSDLLHLQQQHHFHLSVYCPQIQGVPKKLLILSAMTCWCTSIGMFCIGQDMICPLKKLWYVCNVHKHKHLDHLMCFHGIATSENLTSFVLALPQITRTAFGVTRWWWRSRWGIRKNQSKESAETKRENGQKPQKMIIGRKKVTFTCVSFPSLIGILSQITFPYPLSR